MEGKDYAAAKLQTDHLVAVLQEGGNLSAKGEADSVTNLLAAGLQSLLTVTKAQSAELAKCALQQDQQHDPAVAGMLVGAEQVVKEISHTLYQSQCKKDGGDVLARRTLVQIYDYTDAGNNRDSCKESESRHVLPFDARNENEIHDFKLEELLAQISTLGMQLKLNEAGMRALLLSKITGNANLILRGQLTLLNLKQESVKFIQLQRILEGAFMQNSDPKSASTALLKLAPLGRGNRAYLTLQSTIVRWCKLALADVESAVERQCLFDARCSETFLRCLTVNDKASIDRKNLDRAEGGERIMNLSNMVRFLTDLHRVTVTEAAGNFTQHAEAGTSIRRVAEEAYLDPGYQETGGHQEEMNVYEVNYWNPRLPGQMSRGQPRGFSRGPGRQAQGRFPTRGATPRYAGQAPWRPAGQGRGLSRYPALAGAPRPPRGNFPGRGPPGRGAPGANPRGGQVRPQGPSGLPFPWVHETLGVAKTGCFACGQPRGRQTGQCAGFKDPNCPYYGQNLMPGRCKTKSCRGAHQTRNCIGILQGAKKAWQDQVKAIRMASLDTGQMPPAGQVAPAGQMAPAPGEQDEAAWGQMEENWDQEFEAVDQFYPNEM